ncbi:MAG: hypothetical protein H0T73_23155 [Ardenticatenales bacterium]|nr:hypothetical protein [Ardenticatenales bacterium]
MNATDALLIALLPRPADLARAQAGWYRVPLAHAPAALGEAKALAFYQPKTFGEARWQIGWWGRVSGLEVRLRRELLPEEPDHRRAGEPYLCVTLQPLVALDPPKHSTKGRRILFLPTTWAAFQRAETLDDLVARPLRPIADSPLYTLIKQQVADQGGIPDPGSTHQPRLFETEKCFFDGYHY